MAIGSRRNRPEAASGLGLLLAAVTLCNLAAFLYGLATTFYSRPYADVIGHIAWALSGPSGLQGFLAADGEQRSILLRMLLLADMAALGGWLPLYALLSVGCLAWLAAQFAWPLWNRPGAGWQRGAGIAAVLLLLCRAVQHDVHAWAHGLQYMLVTAFGLAAFRFAARAQEGLAPLAGACLFALAAAASFGNGLLVVPLVACIAMFRRRLAAALLLFAAGGLLAWLYLQGLGAGMPSGAIARALGDPAGIAAYLAHFLAVPWGRIPGLGNAVAWASGGLFLAATLALTYRLWRKGPRAPTLALAWLGLPWLALGSGLLAALVRLDLGAVQGGQSRYAVLAHAGWAGLVAAGLLVAPNRLPRVFAALVLAGGIALLAEQAAAIRLFAARAAAIEAIYARVLSGTAVPADYEALHPRPDLARAVIDDLRTRRLFGLAP